MKPFYNQPYPISYAVLGSQGNTITLAHTDVPYVCRNMEGAGKHKFHDLEHDSNMRLFTTYSHTSTLRGYEASRKMLQQRTSDEERKTRKGVQNTPANGGIDRRESSHFHRLARERGQSKGKTGTTQKNRNNNKMRKRWGRKRWSGGVKTSRERPPKRSQKRTRTRYVRKPTRDREMDIVPHPTGATSKPGGKLPEKSPQENSITNPVLPTTQCKIRLRGCYRHRPPLAGFSTRKVPRWPLTFVLDKLLNWFHTRHGRTVQRSIPRGKSIIPF